MTLMVGHILKESSSHVKRRMSRESSGTPPTVAGPVVIVAAIGIRMDAWARRQRIGRETLIARGVLDLRGQSPWRSEEGKKPGPPRELQRKRLELSIYLPLGSKPGNYEVKILRNLDTPLVSAAGTARIENGNTVLNITADLSGLAAGVYLVGVRLPPWDWTYYPVVLK